MFKRAIWMGVCALAMVTSGCDRNAGPTSQPASAPASTSQPVAGENEDDAGPMTERKRLRRPGPNGGELFELGAGIASLELVRNVDTAPHLEIWVWNLDQTSMLPIPQEVIEIQIAAIEKLTDSGPSSFTLRLVADPEWEMNSGYTHFFAPARRMRNIPTFIVNFGALNVRGVEVGNRSYTYPFEKEVGE